MERNKKSTEENKDSIKLAKLQGLEKFDKKI
jgi:hypothetical protein